MVKIHALSLADDALNWLIAKLHNSDVSLSVIDDKRKNVVVKTHREREKIVQGQLHGVGTVRVLCRVPKSTAVYEPNYAADPRQANRLIEQYKIGSYWDEKLKCWTAKLNDVSAYSCTQIKACMVCLVVYKYGSAVDVPYELLTGKEILVKMHEGSSMTLSDVNNWLEVN